MRNKTNIFIATLPRSGSTLLGMMLDAHSEIFHVGESSYWGKIEPQNMTCSCGVVGCTLLLKAHRLMRGHQSVSDIYHYCSYIDRLEEPNKLCHRFSLPVNQENEALGIESEQQLLESCCQGHGVVAKTFRQLTGCNVIVDNTKNTRIAHELVTSHNWKVILLTRDPRGVVNSSKRAGIRKGVPRPIGMKVPVLTSFARQAVNLIQYSKVLHVRYEDLCSNPETTLAFVSQFIGVYFEPMMIDFRKGQGHTFMGNRMRLDSSNNTICVDESWMHDLSLNEVALIAENDELRELYSVLGYDLDK